MRRIRIFFQDHLSSFRTILLSFLLLILLGAGLLSLPIASVDGQPVPFINALFTSTSATCVTGLVVYDTATQWSLFGKTVILILIQIGGLGVVTAIITTLMLTGKQIGLVQRVTMQDAISAPQLGGIVRFTRFFLFGTFAFELLGAVLMAPVFVHDFGFIRGVGYAIFHSVSAFCNAGFDLMGIRGPFSSLTSYRSNILINAVVPLLIIIGGCGFMSWRDLIDKKFHFAKLRLQTKIILTTTFFLIVIPFLYLFFFEFADYPIADRIMASLFQSVTPRTAGFNTVDYRQMSDSGLLVTIILMLIGGAPGSTAGGMKITTFFVIVFASLSFMKGKDKVQAFKRRIEDTNVHNSFALFAVYMTLLTLGSIIMSSYEKIPLIETLFECASALGTVGLTTGITSGLHLVSKLILIFFMYFGRVGGLTLTYAIIIRNHKTVNHYPAEKITVG